MKGEHAKEEESELGRVLDLLDQPQASPCQHSV